eukprot:4454531-Heterocapsa_arctica.AAC.1
MPCFARSSQDISVHVDPVFCQMDPVAMMLSTMSPLTFILIPLTSVTLTLSSKFLAYALFQQILEHDVAALVISSVACGLYHERVVIM